MDINPPVGLQLRGNVQKSVTAIGLPSTTLCDAATFRPIIWSEK
ncbi:Uncharacterised protein [Mycobacterium tuberculosis]|nr:Uncharacterised protein [Mycobacterium tuberculosis]